MSEKSIVQDPLIKYATQIGWTPITRDEAVALRGGEAGLFFYDILKKKLIELNKGIVNDEKADEIIKKLENVKSSIEGNQEILQYLKGKKSVYSDKEKRELDIRFIDFEELKNNEFHVTDEWQYTNGKFTNRGDVVFLINGIPVIIAETKGANKREGIEEGIGQIRRYHAETPELVTSNQIFNVTHLLDFYYGVTWNLDHKGLFNWKDCLEHSEGIELDSSPEPALSVANVAQNDKIKNNFVNFEEKVKSFFSKERILQFIKDYIVFFKKDDVMSKIIMRQHQTRAVEKLIDRALDKKKKTGLIWHAQGAGKTFTMIVAAEKILQQPEFEKPAVIMLVDRNELESQLFRNLDAYGFKIDEGMKIAESKKDLQDLLKSDYRGLIVSMIHKFEGMPKDINTRDNVFVLVDEAHRTTGSHLGNFLMAALPNATYFGFTGTPIDKILYGKGTFKIFGKEDNKGYLDKYSIAESIEDGTTVPLHYTLAPNEIRVPKEMLEKEFFALMEKEGVSDIDELNKLLEKAVSLKNFLKSKDRIKKVAEFVAKHYKENVEPMGYKAFLVGVDRQACALYKKELDKLLPAEYSVVVYSQAHNDTEELKKHYMKESDERDLKGKIFPKKNKLPKILIVTDKLLTGYDAAILYCMYLDKPMKDHTLLQAIARVNRPYEDEDGLKKPSGFVLDFIGIFERLEKALAFDSDIVGSVIKNIDVLKESFAKLMKEKAKPYLELTKGGFDDKTIERAIEYFSDKNKRQDFYGFFKQLEMLYEIISPDKFLRDYMGDYWKISYLYSIIKNAFSRRILLDKELMRKTSDLVQKHVYSTDISSILPIYEIKEDTLKALKESDKSDNVKVINLRKSIFKFVDDNQNEQPYLIEIGEKAQAVIELYDDRRVTTIDALRKLEEIIKEINQARREQAEKNFDVNTFTIYWLFKRDTISKPDTLAAKINDIFEEYPHWKFNSKEKRELTTQLYKILLKEVDKTKAVELVEKILRLERK
ncbi:MAG: HsdR family type I site-specific deoxyribonuclease [Candidatus Omnitrophica bacterium]|nr:HsdR family type I site-specific deoxyribonuclease [Candidatus Omnitrophota bacterium]